jgi:hypothetical protein
VPSFDFALRLRMHGRATDVFHAFLRKLFGQILGDVGRAVIAVKPGFVQNFRALAA